MVQALTEDERVYGRRSKSRLVVFFLKLIKHYCVFTGSKGSSYSVNIVQNMSNKTSGFISALEGCV